MGRLDYTLISKHRWMWPLIELGAITLYTISHHAHLHEARQAARCRAQHCERHPHPQ